MPPKNTTTTTTLFSVPSLFISLSLLCILSLSLFFLSHTSSPPSHPQTTPLPPADSVIKVYVADLPRSLNYGLLEKYWSLQTDTRLGSESDNQIRSTHLWKQNLKYPNYPENPIIKQYSAEYWITGDLMTPKELRTASFARRVFDSAEADVVFVPFFATMSAEMQLGVGKGVFRKKEGNEDYERQREVVDFVKRSEAWKRSGGRDHVFVLTVTDALQSNWLVRHLRSYSDKQKNYFRQNMAKVQPVFMYDNGHLGGIGPVPFDGAVNHIWRKVHQKLPMIKEAIIREKRKPLGVSVPLRCHCT